MHFEFTNALAIFQHLMNDVFHEFLDKFVVCYLDNILIFFKNTEKHKGHEEHLKLILQNLIDVGLCIKLEKCVFHQPQVEFFKYIISNEGLLMDKKKASYHRFVNSSNGTCCTMLP